MQLNFDDKYSYNSYDEYDSYDNYQDEYNYKDDYKDAYLNESYEESYEKKPYKSIHTIFEDDEAESDESNANLMNSMDNDLAGYFSDARLFAPKKKLVDTIKKKPKRVIHKAGVRVTATVNKQSVTGVVLFGPYESNKKQMYQLELDSGEIIEAEEKKLRAK